MRTLKGKRIDKGITQTEIAKKLGIASKTYSYKETGLSEFTLSEVQKLSEELEMDLKEFNDIFLNGKLPIG